MSEDQVVVDSEQCCVIAGIIKQLRFSPAFSNRSFLTHPLEKEVRLQMLFYSVAICHQTRNLKSEKLRLFGWDLIEKVFLDLAVDNSVLFDTEYLNISSNDSVADALVRAFSCDGDTRYTTLDRLGERVFLMKNLSLFIKNNFGGSYTRLLEETNGKLINNGQGLYEILEKTEAFSDPLRKKTSFLAKLLFDCGLFQINDRENYIPIMDYHMQRVLLRLGCVKIIAPELHYALRNQHPIASDLIIRKACIDSVIALAQSSGIEIWKMNDIFWPLGRSCCNETTLCTDKICSKNPCTFKTIFLPGEHKNCSFGDACRSFLLNKSRLLWEPIVETHFY